MTDKTQSEISDRDDALNQRILALDLLPAFEEFYADDVVMKENADPPSTGKAACREHEEHFVGSVERLHSIRLLSRAVDGQTTFSEWIYDITYKGDARVYLEQVAVRHWRGAQVVSERFYYATPRPVPVP